MNCSKKIICWAIAIPVVLLVMHFTWIYCLQIPESNLTQSQVFAIEPGMSATQVSSILGNPRSVKVFKTNGQGTDVTVYLDNFEEITESSNKCTWIFSTQDYFRKSLEIYVNFINQKVSIVAIELDDLAIYAYDNGSDKPFIKNEKLLSRYLNP